MNSKLIYLIDKSKQFHKGQISLHLCFTTIPIINQQYYKKMSACKIKFSVNCNTNFGQVVFICGNTIQLGNWNPQNAMRLYTDARLYPKWDPYRVVHIKKGNKLGFKVCIVQQDLSVRWENISGNREIIANQNIIVDVTANHTQMNIISMPQQTFEKPPRKKTIDILNELESDGSSSKEYWKQFLNQQQQCFLYVTLITQMKRIVESQSDSKLQRLSQQINKKRPKQKLCHDNSLQSLIKKRKQLTKKLSCLYCIIISQNIKSQQISYEGKDSYILKASQFTKLNTIHNNEGVVYFHIDFGENLSQEIGFIQILQNIERIIHAQTKLKAGNKINCFLSIRITMVPTQDMIKRFLTYNVALLIFQTDLLLSYFLEQLQKLGFSFYVQRYNQIIVIMNNLGLMKLVVEAKYRGIQFNQMGSLKKVKNTQKVGVYFQQIKEQISSVIPHQWHPSLPFLQSAKQDQCLITLAYNKKNVLLISCSCINDISPKMLKQVMSLSSKQNFQIYIFVDKIDNDLRIKLSVINNRIVVLGRDGYIYAKQNICIDIYQQLNLDKLKFNQAIYQLSTQMFFGVDNKYILNDRQIIFHFRQDNLGKLGSNCLIEYLNKYNLTTIYKLFWFKTNQLTIKISSFCITNEFYVKCIIQNLTKQIKQQRALILFFNLNRLQLKHVQLPTQLNQELILNNYQSNLMFITVKLLFDQYFSQCLDESIRKGANLHQAIKLRGFFVDISNHIPQNKCLKVTNQQVITGKEMESLLQFFCQHLLAGSNIQSYKLNISTNKKNRRSFAEKMSRDKKSSDNFSLFRY